MRPRSSFPIFGHHLLRLRRGSFLQPCCHHFAFFSLRQFSNPETFPTARVFRSIFIFVLSLSPPKQQQPAQQTTHLVPAARSIGATAATNRWPLALICVRARSLHKRRHAKRPPRTCHFSTTIFTINKPPPLNVYRG